MLKPCSSSDERNRIRSLLCSPGEIRLRFSSATCCHLNCVPNLIRNVESDDLSSIGSSKRKDMYCQEIGVPVNHISNSAFDCFVEEVRKPIYEMMVGTANDSERDKQLLYYLVQKFTENRQATSKHNFKYTYQLHSLSRGTVSVCKFAYIVITGIKDEIINYAQRQVREQVSAESILFGNNDSEDRRMRSLRDTFDYFALDFNLYEQNLNNFVEVNNIPESEAGFICTTFLMDWFQLAGEQEPNANEIHIDHITHVEVFEEYKSDPYVNSHDKVYGYDAFVKIWREVFPKVKIRQYKNVTGKCAVCDACKNMMSKAKSKSMRIIVRQYKLMHRAFYMGEKLLYYQRRAEAATSNGEIASIIIDKMGTHATTLPILSNLNSIKDPFPVTVTGAISHGPNKTTFYLSTPNVATGSSYTIHCILAELRKLYANNRYKCLRKVFIEIDGASDNVAKAVLAACEHLEFKEFAAEILLARLPVGHTHEDIDSRFGKIWTYMRNRHCYTFDKFVDIIKQAFSNSPLITVVPVFAVYDYKAFYDRFIDEELKDKYSRLDFTQLYFKFQPLREQDRAYNPSNIIVRTNYRKFGQEYSIGLRPNQIDHTSTELPFQPVVIHSCWIPESALDIACPHPQPCQRTCTCREEKAPGISFLSAVPQGRPYPLPFPNGWFQSYTKFLECINQFLRLRKEDPSAEYWAMFSRWRMPQSELIEDFLTSYDIDLPLGQYLFGSESFVTMSDSTGGTIGHGNTDGNQLTAFSNNAHRIRANAFDLQFLDHIQQTAQTVPWRGHRITHKNWIFNRKCVMKRILWTTGTGARKRTLKGTCVAWCSADINEGFNYIYT